MEYAAGLELSEEKAAVFHGQDVLRPLKQQLRGLPRESPWTN